MAARPTLPVELLECVVDYLHDDLRNLKSCCLVAKSWVPSSRFHLFHRIELRAPREGRETTCYKLHQVLEVSPDIASYVTEVVVYETSPRIAKGTWIGHEPTLPIVLSKLKYLRYLSILIPPSTWKILAMRWPAKTIPAITAALASTSLTELKLHRPFFTHPGHLFLMIKSCPNLKHLIVDLPEFQDSVVTATPNLLFQSTEVFSDNSRKVKLEMLHLDAEDSALIADCMVHPLSPIDLTTITRFSIRMPDNFSSYATLLRNMPALTSLEILMGSADFDRHWSLTNPIDLSFIPLLEDLHLEVKVMLDRHDPLPWLHALLSTVQPGNHLQEIRLVATIDMPPPYLTIPVYERSLAGWQSLDSLLNMATFDTLRRFRLDFSLDNPIDDRIVPRIAQDFILQLDALHRKGVLEVDVCEVR